MQSKRYVAFVVDDEDMIASTLELILLSKGFDARSFVDPLDALNAAHSVAPNLLLTDVVLPTMDGIELANQIKQLHPDCKVLFSSGHCVTSKQLVNAGFQGEQFAILGKPVLPDSLLAKIEELLGDTGLGTCK